MPIPSWGDESQFCGGEIVRNACCVIVVDSAVVGEDNFEIAPACLMPVRIITTGGGNQLTLASIVPG
jgi:hypothetical protein